MTRRWNRFCRIVVAQVVGLAASVATAQQPDKPAAETNPSPATQSQTADQSDAAKQAKAVFDEKFAVYKSAIREIEELQNKFQTADVAVREKLNAEMTGQVAHAQSLVNDMVEAGMEAYRQAPNADPQITDLLVSISRYYSIGRQVGKGEPGQSGNPDDVFYPIDGGDQYERALPIIKLLIEGNATEKELYVWGFLSAFATNDFDLAAQWLQNAQESVALQAIAEATQKPESQESQPGLAKLVLQQVSASAGVLDEYGELWAKESALRDAEATADNLPRVKLTTTKGEITIELFENEAPQSAANFITLVKQGFYNGSPFHRVLSKFMAQGGAKTDEGEGGPGYAIRCECYRPDYRRHFRGTLSMAHAGRDTGDSQFFLTFVPTPHLNGRHTAFGRVIEGLDVLANLQRRSRQHQAAPPKPDRILKAEVLRDRGHEYKFDKLPGS